MDLTAEIEETQQDLDQLRTALDVFQSLSKATIRRDQAAMFADLQKSVDSVKTTYPLIQARNTLALGEIVSPKKSRVQQRTDQIAIRQHVTHMSEQFRALQASADDGLKHIQEIKKKGDDYEAELGEIEIRLTLLLARCKASLQNAENVLGAKIIAVKNASDTLSAQEKELSELDRKMESGKDQRDVAGSLAAVATATSFIFPPMVLVAGGMTGWAIAANSDRKKHQRQIAEQRTRHRSLQSEYEKLKEQKTMLANTATSTGELLSKCKTLMSGTDRVRPLLDAKLQLYQDIKVTTDDFDAWASELNNQTESIEILGRSDKALENGMQRIIDILVGKEQAEMRKICEPLFVHATNPPPGARSSNPAEERVGFAMALAFSDKGWITDSEFSEGTACSSIKGDYAPVSPEEFMNAVEAGELSNVLEFINAGADINLKHNGWTPLGRAFRKGKLDIVQALVRHGAELETRMDIGWGILPGDGTALNWAAAEGHIEIVNFLVTKNAKIDPDAEKPVFFGTGGTPLKMAAGKGKLDVVRYLLDSGADQASPEGKPGWTAFICACKEGQIEILKYFVQTKGFDVNHRGTDGLTPLHVAAKYNEPGAMKFLVDSGASINIRDVHGNASLHLVASEGRKKAAIWLRLQGADLKLKNRTGMTRLDVSTSMFSGSDPSPDLVKCLDWSLPDPKMEAECIIM